MDMTCTTKYGLAFLFLLTISVYSGCGAPPNPDGREDVLGVIKLNGIPIEDGGTIYFEPVEGDSWGGGRGPILKGGKFHLTQQDGIKPGKYIVRVDLQVLYDKDTDQMRTVETPDWRCYAVQVIPDEFCKKSTIECDVLEGRRNTFNYDIVTDFVPQPVDKNYKRKRHPDDPSSAKSTTKRSK